MWFAIMIIGIWGFGTIGACITKDASVFSDLALVSIILGFGYACYKEMEQRKK